VKFLLLSATMVGYSIASVLRRAPAKPLRVSGAAYNLVVHGNKGYFALARFGLAVTIIQQPLYKIAFIIISITSKAEKLY